MEKDIIGVDFEITLETLDQPGHVLDLPIRECMSIAVADQTDADGLCVVEFPGIADNMCSRKLLKPSISHVHLAIRKAVAISDQEVVAQALIAP